MIKQAMTTCPWRRSTATASRKPWSAASLFISRCPFESCVAIVGVLAHMGAVVRPVYASLPSECCRRARQSGRIQGAAAVCPLCGSWGKPNQARALTRPRPNAARQVCGRRASKQGRVGQRSRRGRGHPTSSSRSPQASGPIADQRGGQLAGRQLCVGRMLEDRQRLCVAIRRRRASPRDREPRDHDHGCPPATATAPSSLESARVRPVLSATCANNAVPACDTNPSPSATTSTFIWRPSRVTFKVILPSSIPGPQQAQESPRRRTVPRPRPPGPRPFHATSGLVSA
jgi:hypothetical protein